MHSHGSRFLHNESLKRHTRIGTGGPVPLLAFAHTVAGVQETVRMAQDKALPLMVFGKGSNIVVPDAGMPGVVLKLGGDLKHIRIDHRAGTVSAGGGAALMILGLMLARQGYPGFTYMGVIPGSVGGAVRMNAGIDHEQAIKKDFLRVRVLDPGSCEIQTLEAAELAFGYRTSCLAKQPLIVLEAVFRLPAETVSAEKTMSALRCLLKKRYVEQPRCFHAFGSTFKNPGSPFRSAGWYLEQVGMQGVRSGGAMVAREHANWIINTGGATTADIVELMRVGRKRVLEKFGLTLQEEVLVLAS